MIIQTNSGSNVEGSEGLSSYVQSVVEGALAPFHTRVSRVEVHLSDENAQKGGTDDKRCLMEARLEGRQPMAVSHVAGTMDQAIDGAAEKLRRSVESTVEKMQEHR